jgi:hypothetical protein
MRTIWKYPLAVTDAQHVTMQRGAKVLAAQAQDDALCLWALVETNEDTEQRVVYVVGTGHPVIDNIADFTHVGTVQFQDGALVFHVFISAR